MYIEKVAIKNFKAIDDIEIEFRPGVNLLIGDNGVGKTSILEVIDAQTYRENSQLNYVQAKTEAQSYYSGLIKALNAYESL